MAFPRALLTSSSAHSRAGDGSTRGILWPTPRSNSSSASQTAPASVWPGRHMGRKKSKFSTPSAWMQRVGSSNPMMLGVPATRIPLPLFLSPPSPLPPAHLLTHAHTLPLNFACGWIQKRRWEFAQSLLSLGARMVAGVQSDIQLGAGGASSGQARASHHGAGGTAPPTPCVTGGGREGPRQRCFF